MRCVWLAHLAPKTLLWTEYSHSCCFFFCHHHKAYIRVLDMNEHRPVFQKNLYEVRVPEDTAPWKEILQVSAEDADINSRLIYSIHGSVHPDSGRHFQLDPRSGGLVMSEQLDFETLPLHILIIMVNSSILVWIDWRCGLGLGLTALATARTQMANNFISR